MGRKKRPTSPLSPFYGHPAESIAEWIGVSVGTAEHYKAGRRKPPTPALRLFRLYRERKVLSNKCWEGFQIIEDKILDPDGNPICPSDFALWGLVWQALAEADSKKYYELLKKAANS